MGYRNQGLVTCGSDEVTDQDTTSATLEDIPGLAFAITLDHSAAIQAHMAVSCEAGGVAVGAWAIEISGVDGTESQRSITGANDIGSVAVQARSGELAAGSYSVKGRHRRVSGAVTVTTIVGQVFAFVVDL